MVGACLGACLSVALVAAAQSLPPRDPGSKDAADGGSHAPGSLVDEIAGIVEAKFYSPAWLEQVGWNAAVARARREFAATDVPAERTTILRKLVASLKTSHTTYYPRSDPGYWFWTSLFEQMLERVCPREQTPGFPVARVDIGGPADKAGLRPGDRILAADGQPFSPVDSFAGRAGKPVSLQVQRACGAPAIAAVVTPQTTRPQEELRQATADSWRIIEHHGHRIAYIHMWSWATIEFQKVLLDAIAKSNTEGVDGFVLDIRDGWGGASASFLGVFWKMCRCSNPSAATARGSHSINRSASRRCCSSTAVRAAARRPSPMARKHRMARLIGERTAGAYLGGGPSCLSDGSLLVIAMSEGRVDGERLEGRGVAPDIEVPFDFPLRRREGPATGVCTRGAVRPEIRPRKRRPAIDPMIERPALGRCFLEPFFLSRGGQMLD